MTDFVALVVLNTTVLSYFAVAGRPDLVTHLWPQEACTTPEAIAEYAEGVAVHGLPADAWRALPVLELTEAEQAFAQALPARLKAGERSCLAAAYHRRGLIATDDRDARSEARRHDIGVTGILGILVRCVHDGLLSREAANTLLTRMIAAGYRSPVGTIDPLLGEV